MEDKDKTLDPFDLAFGSLEGRPGVTMTKPTTLRSTLPIVGLAQTFIVQTVRLKEEPEDEKKGIPPKFTVFIEYVDRDRHVRLVVPPNVADAMDRQRESLTTRARVSAARRGAKTRAALGIKPGFMKKKKG